MKLRQKLAMVLATAMVVTAVPVTTMAATNNTLTNTVTTIKGETLGYTKEEAQVNNTTGSVFAVSAKAPKLTLTFTENHTAAEADNETAFISIESGSFTNEAFLAALLPEGENLKVDKDGYIRECSITAFNGVKAADAVKLTDAVLVVDVLDKNGDATGAQAELKKAGSQFRVTIKSNNTAVSKDDYIVLPLYVVAGEKDNIITVDGANSIISSGKFSLTNGTEVGTKALTATVGTTTVIEVEGGEIAPITLTENVIGKLAGQVIEIKLPHSSDLTFYNLNNVKAVGGRAYAGQESSVTATFGEDSKGRPDYQTLKITLPNWVDANATGTVELKGIHVGPEGNADAELGDVTVTIKGDNVTTLSDVKVAEVKDYTIGINCAEPVQVVAGKSNGTVKFKLVEDVKDTMIKGRRVEFTFENGFIATTQYMNEQGNVEKEEAYDVFMELVDEEVIVLPKTIKKEDIRFVNTNDKGQITGFEVVLNNIKTSEANVLEFKMPIMTDVENTGEIKVVAEGRSIGGKLEAVKIADVVAPIEVTVEPVTLKVGLKGQAGGKIEIKETDKVMLEKGWLNIRVDETTGIKFDKNQKLNITTNDIQIDKDSISIEDNQISFYIERVSKEAGMITIKDMVFDVDRTAPEGKFDIAIFGDALSQNVFNKEGLDAYQVEDVVVVGTPNTEDNATSNGLKKGVGIFKVGEKTYTVNGEAKEMDATPYISKANRIMVPVKYVSDVFGVNGKDVMFSKENGGTITIFAGSRVLQVVNGSNIALVNGVRVPMTEKVTIIDGRTYVPVGEMARLLDVEVEWSNETKTATFVNR